MPAAELLFPSPPPTVVVAAATDDTENSTTRAAVTAANAVKEQENGLHHHRQKQQKQHQQQQQQKQERKNHVEVCVRIRPLVVQKGIRSNSFFARKEPVVNKKNGSNSSSSSSIAHKGTTRENRNNSKKTSLLTPPPSSRLRKPQIPRQPSALPHKSTDKQAQTKDKNSSSNNNNNNNKTHTTTDDDNVIPTQSCAWDVVTNDTVRQNEHVTEIVQGRTCQYTFDQVYGPACTTQDIFQNSSIHELVQAAMQGYHTAVLAYGQTSTGKTHTMTGTVQQPGLIPLSIQACFDYINKKQHEEEEENREYLLRVSYLEVYNEHIRDLLLPPHTKTIVPIRLFESPSSSSEAGGVGGAGGGAGLVIKGLTEQVVTSPAQVFQLLQQGEARRQVGATSLNQHSSRSHVMVRIWIESRATVVGSQHTTNSASTSGGSNSGTVSSTSSVSSSATTTTFPTGAVRVSSLSLVDLAGSESVRLTGGNSDRRSEGHYINKSLMTLGQVVYALSEDDNNNSNGNDVGGIAAGNSGIKKHIPYRDSKLTRLLQPCLSGNAQVCVLCCISPLPGHLEESHNTLKFATRAKKIPQRATIQETIIGGDEEKTLLQSYRQEIEDLRRQLKEAQEVQQRLLLKQQQQQQQSEVGSMTTTASTTPSLSRTSTGLSTSSFDFDNEVSESEIHELVNAIATMEKLILKSSSPSIAAAAATTTTTGNKDVMPIKPEDLLDFSDNFLEEDDDDRKDEQDLLALVSGGSNSSAVPTATPSASKTLVRQVTSEPATPSNDDDDEDGNNNNANTSELHGELSRIKGLLGSVLQKRFRGSINNNSNNNNTNNEPPDDDIVRNLRAQLEEQQVTSSLRQADASFLQAQLTEKDNLLQEVSKLLEAVEERQTALEQENKALREQVARLKQKQQREQQQQSQQEDNDEEESLYSL